MECNTKASIKAACMDEGWKRYLQSSITPMMQEPLLSDFGYLGMTPAADAVLDGTYVPPPAVDEMARNFLTHLKRLDFG
jgi:hypothetical protein